MDKRLKDYILSQGSPYIRLVLIAFKINTNILQEHINGTYSGTDIGSIYNTTM